MADKLIPLGKHGVAASDVEGVTLGSRIVVATTKAGRSYVAEYATTTEATAAHAAFTTAWNAWRATQ